MAPDRQERAKQAEEEFWQKFRRWQQAVKDANHTWKETESARSQLADLGASAIGDINRLFARTIFRETEKLEAELDEALAKLKEAREAGSNGETNN